jgi:predicted small secreted protein
MTRRMALAWAAAVLLSTTIAACASTSAGTGSNQIGVEVRNDLVPSSALTIYVVPETGARRLLGSVSPSETKMLSFQEVSVGQYRLMARTTGGQEIVSNPIILADARTLRWNLSSNILTVIEERG